MARDSEDIQADIAQLETEIVRLQDEGSDLSLRKIPQIESEIRGLAGDLEEALEEEAEDDPGGVFQQLTGIDVRGSGVVSQDGGGTSDSQIAGLWTGLLISLREYAQSKNIAPNSTSAQAWAEAIVAPHVRQIETAFLQALSANQTFGAPPTFQGGSLDSFKQQLDAFNDSGAGLSDVELFNNALAAGLNTAGTLIGIDSLASFGSKKSTGGTGARRPTAAEIRQGFDLDELSLRAQEIWRTNLLVEHGDPKSLAKAYVETIVNNPDQRVDFDTFIATRARQTERAKMIFQNRPEDQSHEEFIGTYWRRALAVLGGSGTGDETASELAGAGAALNANQDAFTTRLGLTNTAQKSAEQINRAANRALGLKSFLGL